MSEQIRELKTSGGHLVVLKTFLTGREVRSIRNSLTLATDMRTGESGKLSMEDLDLWEDSSIKAAVVSVDGQSENVVDLVLSLPGKDYSEVYDAIQELKNPLSPEEKKE